jgi:two-component system, NtrC family, response regulator HydG
MEPHILIVDDEKSMRYTFESFLSDEGYRVTAASSCKEGIALLKEEDIDLVFADIFLPNENGNDFLKVAKEIRPDILVTMITGAPSIDSAAESLRLGAFDYIIKPITQEILLRAVSMALKHNTLSKEKEQCRLNFEAIFRSVNDGIITVDENMSVVEINEAVEKICDFQRGAVIGKPLDELPDHCEGNCLHALRETVENRQPVELRFVECHTDRGRRQIVSVTATPLIGSREHFSGAVMVVRDETRLTNLERRLSERQTIDNIVGRSVGIEKVRSLIRDLADVQTTVLIIGESGTGKELVVDALHYCGERRDGPLVKVNCTALSESLLESELFGHVAGAFTGAMKDKAGRFQRADGGTIFLDEIGDISPRMQLRLLRVIETMMFEKVGDSTPVKTDVRIVAATNSDLHERVATGEFREDLYYRLKVVQVDIPPLRHRRDDIPLLVEHFRRKFNTKLGREIKGISSDIEQMFLSYPWAGNVRELENLMEHAFIRCRRKVITAHDLPRDFCSHFETHPISTILNEEEEADALLRTLEQTGGNKSEAARLLGMSRRNIYRKIEKHGISVGN